MDQYELIRTAYRVYGKSIRAIAKEFGHHRSTVRKIIKGKLPKYERKKAPHSPVMEPVADIVVNWIKEDQNNPVKQRHTARRIYTRLVEEHGFTGGESTVRRWVRLKKRELGFDQAEAMVPLCPEVGKEAEVDWGVATVVIGGVSQKVKIFCMRSRYSGKSFVRAYPLERQEMFFDAHAHAFQYFGGIHPVLVYDNLTTAVRRVLQGNKREQQARFVEFRSYYTFEARFCNPGKGHEKGGVEGLVGYARRNFMVPIPEVQNFEELNRTLIQQCEKHSEKRLPGRAADQNIKTQFEEEKKKLLPLPDTPFDSTRQVTVKVSKYQTVQLERNWYSTPTPYVGTQLRAHIGCWTVSFYDGAELIAEHDRCFKTNQWILDPLHYLKLLQRKPGAFLEARPILDWREKWPKDYEILLEQLLSKENHKDGILEFLSILLLHQEYPEEVVSQAIQEAVASKIWNYESIKHLILRLQEVPFHSEPLEKSRIPGVTDKQISAPNLSCYDQLIKEAS